MNKHYYFKYQKGNKAFKKFLKDNKYKEIPLSIYFGKWRCKDYQDHKKDDKQVETFFKINESKDDHYFWIFFKEKIYVYTPKENKIIDGPDELIDDNGSFPKSIICSLKKDYEKIKLPQGFSNINANQKYNRKTIVEFEGVENEIANSLVTGNRINIKQDKFYFLNYLSPIEFETLCFLIFNTGKSHCSAYRGGALPTYDLRVKNNGQYKDLEDTFWVQVKKKETDENIKIEKGMYLFYLGDTDIEKRYLGKDWILDIIKNNYGIKKWLKELFKE